MLRNTLAILSLATLLALSSLSTAPGNQLQNGGFELPAFGPNNGATYNPSNEDPTFSWAVIVGDVDVVHIPYLPFIAYSAFELNQSLDLNGNTNGGITQFFPTVPGQRYSLSFAYADNSFEGGISSAAIQVNDVATTNGILLTDSISHSTSTNSPAFADWIVYTNTFRATTLVTQLSFLSTSANSSASGGIFLDDVQVNAIPEPAALALVALSAVAGSFSARRRRIA